jgi:hypothetical protein
VICALAMISRTTAVIGAGPYGLSVAAHLRGRGVPIQVFGEPMESWRKMPTRMLLKSVWSASSLSDPEEAHSLDRYRQIAGMPVGEAIPLAFFIDYAMWFQEHEVPQIDRSRVTQLRREADGFHLTLEDGGAQRAAKVVVAVGVRQFAHIPDFARDLPSHLVSHTGDHVDFSRFRDCRVVVVGAGQSALESAAILSDEGARVEVISRGPVHWISRTLYEHGGPLRRVLYPPTDVGPPVLNWLCASPLLMSRLPAGVRQGIERRAVRPAGAHWLRSRVDGKVPITAFTSVRSLSRLGQHGLRLHLGDGTVRDVDHLLLGTGYRPQLEHVDFLDPSLRAQVLTRGGFPLLNQWFETSVPGLHFVGGLAGRTFGPICRFVAGAQITARQVARKAAELN